MDWAQVFRCRGGWIAEVCVGERAVQAKGSSREEAVQALAEKLGHVNREAA